MKSNIYSVTRYQDSLGRNVVQNMPTGESFEITDQTEPLDELPLFIGSSVIMMGGRPMPVQFSFPQVYKTARKCFEDFDEVLKKFLISKMEEQNKQIVAPSKSIIIPK